MIRKDYSCFEPSAEVPAKDRIVFLDYLRAIACLLVILGHVFFMGLNGYEAITPYAPSVTPNIFGSDSAERNVLTGPALFVGVKLGVNVGTLGVALFFLISGFVILKAVEQETRSQFIIRRVFRIYPVSLAAVFLTGAVTTWYCQLTGTLSPHTWQSMLSSGLVANGYMHYFETVPVLWSLEVELFFYIIMAVLAAMRCLGFNGILSASSLCLAFTMIVNTPIVIYYLPQSLVSILVHISFITLQVTFLFIGSIIYRMIISSSMGHRLMYFFASVLVFEVAHYGYLTLHGNSGGVDIANSAWTLGIFSLAFWSEMRWCWIKPLSWVGEISYPLYLTLIPLAWIFLAFLGGLGWGMAEAVIASGGLVVFVAWIIHVFVETPGRRVGAKVGFFVSRFLDGEKTHNKDHPSVPSRP